MIEIYLLCWVTSVVIRRTLYKASPVMYENNQRIPPSNKTKSMLIQSSLKMFY